MDVAHFIGQIAERLSAENLLAAGLLSATALACALIAYLRTAETYAIRDFLEFAIPRAVITHPSARADLLFYITRKAIMPFLLIPAGVTFVVAVGYATHRVIGAILGIDHPVLGTPGPVTIVVFTATMLLAYDLSYYLYHTAQHRFPFLWELHKVHHSAEVMVGITKDRVHPLDELMNRAWDGVIPGICFGLWSLVALNPVELTVFGINVYVMRNILMMDFVRHTHFRISFGRLNAVILCPHWHQLHHSTAPQHYDKNFGLLFSFWDRLFGTLCVPHPDEEFTFGLVDRDVADYQSLSGLYLLPLKKMGRRILRLRRRRRDLALPTRPGA
jgi:sterol desaturase/sphingolipid hydroxylase (fatty acid hydroxylase superfamily)